MNLQYTATSDGLARETMAAVDHAWFDMDRPDNPMVVSAILELENVTDLKALVVTVVERLLKHRRFRQRVETRHGPPRWVDDPNLDLGYHVHVHALPGELGETALRAAIADDYRFPLDRERPLWRSTYYPRGDGTVMLLFRAHHAVADGIAMLRILLSLTDREARRHSAAEPQPAETALHTGPLGGLIDRLETLNETLAGLSELIVEDFRDPARLVEQLHTGSETLRAAARVLRLPDDNPAALHRALSGHRNVAWSSRLRFAPLHHLAQSLGIKINDLFLAALAGAFGRYLRQEQGTLHSDQNLRVSIPVNLRSPGDGDSGNRFGLVLVDLPVGVADPAQRIALVAQRMAALKQSPEARAVLLSLAAAAHLPAAIEKGLIERVSDKSAAVVSNLPGPKRSLRLAGARLANLVFWPPQTGRIGLGLSLLSYAGHVTVGVSADSGIVAQPQLLIDAFEAEIHELQQHARATKRPARRTTAGRGPRQRRDAPV